MKIFSAEQIRKWDACTIANEPIASIDLMERAARACCNWILKNHSKENRFQVFCGKGNNGGDGLALARMLIKENYPVTVYILEFGNKGTGDFQVNLERIHQCTSDIHFLQSPEFFPALQKNDRVIDALFGTGLNKPVTGTGAALIDHINRSGASVIAIDLPSGLFADTSSVGNHVTRASHTLSFQQPKQAFLLPENEEYCGEVHLLDIGLNRDFEKTEPSLYEMTDARAVKSIYRPRKKFSHKGTCGHAALLAGSKGMLGAALLSAEACLRSGAGKLTCYIPECGYAVMQAAVPEALCRVSGREHLLAVEDTSGFDAVGIGPGIGLHPSHHEMLKGLFSGSARPLLLDADALNTIALDPTLLDAVPPLSVLTPHPGEFRRLFGPVANDFERLQLALHHSKEKNLYIVLKGHYTFISTPSGMGYFNPTGNPGMATAGSGDVLSGMITGLLAQGYEPGEAARLGVYLHGLAGDKAAAQLSQEALIAGDLSKFIGEAFKSLADATE